MKEKHKEKRSKSSDKHHKNKKKHKKKYETSSDSDSSNEELQWVEASSISKKSIKKKKKKQKKSSTSSSDSESGGDEAQWKKVSSNSKQKKKKHKKKYSSSNNSESSDEEINNNPIPTPHTVGKRDSWMNEESFVHTLSKDEMYTSSRQKRVESIRAQREKEEKIQEERELNPHWRKDGTGLPEKETSVDSLALPSTSVGDGGYSWLKKAYYRIQEQAQQEGRSMEEVAIERWGSLSKLTSLIEEAEKRMKSHPDIHFKSKYDRYDRNKSDKRHFKKPQDSYESKSTFDSPFQFRKPSDDCKSRKILNHFKSKRTNDANYIWEKEDHNDSDTSLHKKHLINNDEMYSGIKKSSSESRVPAWKKPKCTESQEMSDPSEAQISKSPLKEVVKETDNMPIIYSEDDLNKLAAKQIKAEIMGDMELAKTLQKQLEDARRVVEEKGFAKQHPRIVEEVILTKLDRQGNVRPVQAAQERVSDYKQKKSNKYFDDGSSYSLKQMFEREKLTTSDDHVEMFVEASTQNNETEEIDYESGQISKKLSKKLSSTRQEERDIGKAIKQHQKHAAALEKCHYCLDQPLMKKHLIVHVGENVYLSLPNYQSMTEGHCLIVPKNHVSSFLSLDENEWREVSDFKNQLRNMFRSEHKSIIFLETSMHHRYFPHAVLECIPVPEEEGDMAPLYFKKAIQECEAEWSLNKKLIDLTNKGLRHSVPKGLPYFYVEFDPKVHAGYAHVIEDEKYFPRNFGKEVVGGMLDIDHNDLYKNKKECPLKKSQEAMEFGKKWKNFLCIK